MNILLDTHIFLRAITADNRLSPDIQARIQDKGNTVYLSVVSIWEATVQYELGKLPLPEAPQIYLPKQREIHQVISLSLDEGSVQKLPELPLLHRDPFDRMLICQALHNELIIATVDSAICAYPVRVL